MGRGLTPVPPPQLLALLLPALPLTEDFEENSAVFGYLLQLQPEQVGLYGSLWGSMGPYGGSVGPCGSLWGLYGALMGFYGVLEVSVGHYGVVIGLCGVSRGVYGSDRKSVV